MPSGKQRGPAGGAESVLVMRGGVAVVDYAAYCARFEQKKQQAKIWRENNREHLKTYQREYRRRERQDEQYRMVEKLKGFYRWKEKQVGIE